MGKGSGGGGGAGGLCGSGGLSVGAADQEMSFRHSGLSGLICDR
ncbi:hypothetical protein SLNWT_4181 [Streptomyces albus]|uniref:Uncharacterized protein n=1 Tax=Streptomyces albus (strain ATCC 21838 / DSM 41398 / FERM P-419 / JCM 4703 / NBRC 107858) TaxID=1081613 RepID=A0A0B5F2J8_STRA4|nr:hypothetical protein SLNWT_4181 [Streptomyces albus]AOU78867.1 hypothetical protein SLNHY_4176 [Streptomyces albus]AYN34603.1 hypothetical protein DUI70_4104 [Streptomyces albus]